MASALDAGLASSEQRMDAARREFAAAMSSGATGSAAGGSPARSPAAASKREQLVARRTAMAQRRLAVRTPVESRFGSMQREAPSDAAAAAAAAAASERDEAAAQETRESVDQLLLDLQQLRGLNMQEASAAASARPVSPKPGTPTSIPMPVRAANLAASPRRAERGGVARDAAPRPQPAFGSGTAAGRSPQAAPPASPVAREAADAAVASSIPQPTRSASPRRDRRRGASEQPSALERSVEREHLIPEWWREKEQSLAAREESLRQTELRAMGLKTKVAQDKSKFERERRELVREREAVSVHEKSVKEREKRIRADVQRAKRKSAEHATAVEELRRRNETAQAEITGRLAKLERAGQLQADLIAGQKEDLAAARARLAVDTRNWAAARSQQEAELQGIRTQLLRDVEAWERRAVEAESAAGGGSGSAEPPQAAAAGSGGGAGGLAEPLPPTTGGAASGGLVAPESDGDSDASSDDSEADT